MIRSVAADGRPDLGGVFRPIDRPRVLDRLATAAQYRIATIIAPAGFGKSVAVRQFIATVASVVVYDVPPDGSTLLPFVRGFADALESVVPALRRSLATAFDGARSSDAPGRDLAAWVATHIRMLDTLIVVDDLHNGENDPEISRFITALVDRTKDGPRWLFSSRSPLQLPVASWLAYGESDLVVDAVDLRFNIDEAKQSARATRVAVRDEELEQILGLIDGWPAALTFALRTSTRASDLRAVSAGTREMVYRYLAEQVWHSLDDRIRGFLRTAAFLPRLETRLAVAAGFDDAASIIEALRERVAFISVLDAGVYKLHDLFRDFVQRQVALDGDEALREAQVTAGRLLEKMGMYGEALERFSDARAAREVERVLAEYNFSLLDKGCFDIVERAVRSLPAAISAANPKVLALRAALEDAHGRVDQAERWYSAVLDRVFDDIPFRVAVASRYALLLFQQRRFDAVPILEALRNRDDLDAPERAVVLGMLAMTYALAGRGDEAKTLIAEAIELSEFGDDSLRARTYARAATIAFYASDDAAVETYAREGTRLAMEAGEFILAARTFSTLTAVHAFAGRIPVAAWYAAQVAANAEKGGDPQSRVNGLRTLLQLEAERGNDERIAEIDRELSSVSYRGPIALMGYVVGKAMQLTWSGQLRDAHILLTSVLDKDVVPFQNPMRYSLLAVVFAKLGARTEAIDALAKYDAAVASDTDRHRVFERARGLAERHTILANILLQRIALAQKQMRALHAATADLQAFDAALAALVNRVPERYAAAVRDMRLAGIGGFARFVEFVSDGYDAPVSTETESLTPVELQVLRAMAQGLSNQAIADGQHRTINTVRTHVSSILRKLNCASRGEAVATARRQALV
ncbi:MAG: ATP-dependent transcriptional regulator, MalT-like, LuxR family [Candidatus Eremiobacteraeota bacterium]|nr:ATP-dependent transcriptional regulator, MalT-like, LuxR family [Candidatus Eremiobacteraeota bacterium]